MTIEKNVLTKICTDIPTLLSQDLLCATSVSSVSPWFHSFLNHRDTENTEVAQRRAVSKESVACPAPGHTPQPSWTRLWPNSEDAPEPSVKHEGLLSPIEIVAWYTTRATGPIHRNHFVVRRGSNPI